MIKTMQVHVAHSSLHNPVKVDVPASITIEELSGIVSKLLPDRKTKLGFKNQKGTLLRAADRVEELVSPNEKIKAFTVFNVVKRQPLREPVMGVLSPSAADSDLHPMVETNFAQGSQPEHEHTDDVPAQRTHPLEAHAVNGYDGEAAANKIAAMGFDLNQAKVALSRNQGKLEHALAYLCDHEGAPESFWIPTARSDRECAVVVVSSPAKPEHSWRDQRESWRRALLVPREAVGSVIGKRGQMIAKLQATHNVRIKVEEDYTDDGQGRCVIRGDSAEVVDDACAAVNKVIRFAVNCAQKQLMKRAREQPLTSYATEFPEL